jgi:hypothetical protein
MVWPWGRVNGTYFEDRCAKQRSKDYGSFSRPYRQDGGQGTIEYASKYGAPSYSTWYLGESYGGLAYYECGCFHLAHTAADRLEGPERQSAAAIPLAHDAPGTGRRLALLPVLQISGGTG